MDQVDRLYEKRDVSPPCECVDWVNGLTVQGGEMDSIVLDEHVTYVTVGVKPKDGLYLLDEDDIRLGIMRYLETQ